MSLEQQLGELTATLKILVTVMQSGAAGLAAPISAVVGVTETVADTAKTDTKPETAAEKKKRLAAAAASTETKAPTVELTWKEVLDKIKEVNASTKDGHGRPAVEALLKQFFPTGQTKDAAGADVAAKVPHLEALKKHAEVLAWVTARLAGEPAADEAEDDLGI